jgi:hypothetical protein
MASAIVGLVTMGPVNMGPANMGLVIMVMQRDSASNRLGIRVLDRHHARKLGDREQADQQPG